MADNGHATILTEQLWFAGTASVINAGLVSADNLEIPGWGLLFWASLFLSAFAVLLLLHRAARHANALTNHNDSKVVPGPEYFNPLKNRLKRSLEELVDTLFYAPFVVFEFSGTLFYCTVVIVSFIAVCCKAKLDCICP